MGRRGCQDGSEHPAGWVLHAEVQESQAHGHSWGKAIPELETKTAVLILCYLKFTTFVHRRFFCTHFGFYRHGLKI
jgi:hypothetical protein